ncbi:hypothetical protein PIB30_052590 [Stylosanthes scabra]|uniref:Uncharacterized protein n=1 Tax=Stylosanthes scabra TaxID=79078 RepID=A0ABU6QI17_9FABA|nr:hypothetical protein [Stylosanthes scabra]
MTDKCGKTIGNGLDTFFWTDQWIHQDCRLSNLVTSPIPTERLQDKVADYVDRNGHWDIRRFQQLIPPIKSEQYLPLQKREKTCYAGTIMQMATSLLPRLTKFSQMKLRRSRRSGNLFGNGKALKESKCSCGDLSMEGS